MFKVFCRRKSWRQGDQDGDGDDGVPDLRSFDTVLTAAARIRNRTVTDKVWGLVSDRGMNGDVYTYNARIRAALSAKDGRGGGRGGYNNDRNDEALGLVLEALLDETEVKPDRYNRPGPLSPGTGQAVRPHPLGAGEL